MNWKPLHLATIGLNHAVFKVAHPPLDFRACLLKMHTDLRIKNSITFDQIRVICAAKL
jgi:hypothetical protein